MISLNHIGNLGRLANQMFQYASLKGIATNRGYDFVIPPRQVFGQKDPVVKSSDLILYDVFDLESKNNIDLSKNPILQERMHDFDEELFVNCPDNIDLFGYYQTEKYFKHIGDQIREDFTFHPETFNDCKQLISSVGDEVISLHVRRGDYVTNPNHPTQDCEYYGNALSKMPDNFPVLIFSDDPVWCKDQKIFDSDRFMIAEDNRTDIDLCLMSLCQYHIIANSSFSWWGAWLAKSKHTIAPKNWFGGECVNKSIDDYSFGNFEFL
jgi:hypothetical protein